MSGTTKHKAQGQRLERLLGPGAAALLGAASAFFCFAMPAALLDALGLPAAVAESRLALAVGLGLAVGLATWFGFASLDRSARPRAAHVGAPEGEADLPPVLRRADAHPDAPPRRPIFAGSDLGTPLDLIDPLPVDWAEPVVPAPAPIWPVAPETPREAAVEYAEFRPIEAPAPAPAPAPAGVAAPVARAEAPAPVPAPPLSAMMARLEAGLARKALALAGAEPNVTPLKREIRPIGGTLRAAIDELQQITAARR